MQIQLSKNKNVITQIACYHCGEPCQATDFEQDAKQFCCHGCLTVYELLKENELCQYYDLNDKAGINQKMSTKKEKFTYLDLPEVQAKLFDFADGKTGNLTFFIPTIHCSSCIWLLEHLYKLDENIFFSQINFLKKQLVLSFDLQKLKLSEVVALLASIGYEPSITLNDVQEQNDAQKDRKMRQESRRLIAQIAVAGFAFGNVMMLSFPEYFGLDSFSEQHFKSMFGTLNLLFSIPVLLFSGQDYITISYQNLRKGILHVDFPLALGMLVLWMRSIFEIFTETGAGYIDSMSGLIFFLLVGRWFQQRTSQAMRYDRDFKSYFPIAVIVKAKNGEEIPIQVNDLQAGDRIIVRNEEIIPVDAQLLRGNAQIDYSFVTGEASPLPKSIGETIYAGGKQKGEQIELLVLKKASQSYLTQLWNNTNFNKNKDKNSILQTILNRYFTLTLILIACFSASYWLFFEKNVSVAINVFTAVLVIACPCALSLGSQFALGTALSILGKHKFYLKNIQIVEQIAENDTIVFDKTGTITENQESEVKFCSLLPSSEGENEASFLRQDEIASILALSSNSTHPLSVKITHFLEKKLASKKCQVSKLEKQQFQYASSFFKEQVGKGLEGIINSQNILVGSEELMLENGITNFSKLQIAENKLDTKIFVAINSVGRGYFVVKNKYRKGIEKTIQTLHDSKLDLYLLSGDNEGEKKQVKILFPKEENLYFQQNPHQKLAFIKALQAKNKNVMMIGDGLNDAGALLQSDTGIALTENTAYFTPASDAIIDATALPNLPQFIKFCRFAVHKIRQSFIIALIYNLIGLFFALQGLLSPLISAILMPMSSLTVILFTTWGVKRFKF
jgi:Cu+-exporting ATPase